MTRCIPCVEKKLRRLLTEEKAKNAELESELAAIRAMTPEVVYVDLSKSALLLTKEEL